MKDLALIKETMSSIEIAELTGKMHKHVMEAIRNMEPAWVKVNGSNFRLVEYRDSKGEMRPCYELTPKAEYYDRTLMAKNTVSTTVIAKELGMSAVTLNKKLKEMGIQYKVGQTWVLTSKYQNMGYTDTQTYTETIDDETRSYVSTVWTQKGREFIHGLFRVNKESELFSDVSELKNAIREEDDLKTRIESLGKPILNDMKQIPLLLDKYKMMIAKDKLSVYERRVFLFVVVSLFDPKALAGKKMKHGLREVIGSSLGFENKSTISDNMNDISSYYVRTPKFRKDTKRAFMRIGGYQAN